MIFTNKDALKSPWYAMYTIVRTDSSYATAFDHEKPGRITWHRQSWFHTLEEANAHFEDYCKQYPQMPYVVITPKDPTNEEPPKSFHAGWSKYDGQDWCKIVYQLEKNYNIVKERDINKPQ